MKVCFPVHKDEGMESKVYNHFGSAPMFVIHDTEAGTVEVINNGDQHHAHGACNPLRALNGRTIDAIVVGGIGAGALNKLNQAGIKVYRAGAATIAENAALFSNGGIVELTPQQTCGGHSQGGGCAH